MSTVKHAFRLLREHDDGPSMGDYHEWWADDRIRPEYRDAIGRRNNGNWYRWGFLRCNNPDCTASAIYRTDIVDRLAAKWEADRVR